MIRGVPESVSEEREIPMPVEKQVVIIFAGTNGYLDTVPSDKLKSYEEQLFAHLEKNHPGITQTILSSGKIDDALRGQLEGALKGFAKVFTA